MSAHPIISELRNIRLSKKLSQEAVAGATGNYQSYISRCELGEHFPSIGLISNWAESLGYELVLRAKETA